jgi:hypothetical protein
VQLECVVEVIGVGNCLDETGGADVSGDFAVHEILDVRLQEVGEEALGEFSEALG